jgi:stage V sporulation protein AC
LQYFKMSKGQYAEFVKKKSPNSNTFVDTLKAFLVGGLICCVGQALFMLYGLLDLSKDLRGTLMSMTLVFLGALLTGLGAYDDIAKFGGAGTLVPITGFANAMVSPALEFKTEGLVTGTGAKMFIIAGPVIVYGTSASVVYGLIYWLVSTL